MKIMTLQGDITTVSADAIVNAANSSLMGGGGVDGAIHKAAGPELLKQCIAIREKKGPCPTGQVVATGAAKLQAKHILHAVGPVWIDGFHDEETLLRSCYRNALSLAAQLRCRSIAFPAISTGIFGFPAELAVRCVFDVMEEAEFDPSMQGIDTVLFVLRGEEQAKLYHDYFPPKLEVTNSPASMVHAFLAGKGVDARGRSLEDILAFSNQQLETVHDYIQWLFPLIEPSRFNPEAPLLDSATIQAIRNDSRALNGQWRALERMLTFYDITDHWAESFDHNLLRITRILSSCRILQGPEVSQSILVQISLRCEALGFDPGEVTKGYWEGAA